MEVSSFHETLSSTVSKPVQQGIYMRGNSSLRTNLTHFVRSSIKEKLDGIVNTELDNAGEITPKTWKIVAHNITKSVKYSPTMTSLLQNIQSTLHLSIKSFISYTENDPISDLPVVQSALHRPVNNEVRCRENGDMLQCEQLDVGTSHPSSLKVRKQVLHSFLQSVLPEVTENDSWPQIQLNLRQNLCEKDNEVFNLSLMVHAKLMQSSSQVCIKEGFINLVEGMHLFYSSNHNLLPSFKNGIDVTNPIHHHLNQISQLIIEVVREMAKNWLRYGERRVEEVAGAFVNLLSMHTYDNRFNLPRDIMFPFHILSVLDPKAKWCTHWLHGAFGRHLFLNTLSQNSAFIIFLVGETLSYLKMYQNYHPEYISQNIISGNNVKYATFAHSLSVLSKVICYKKGRQFFPVAVKTTSELISLDVILVRMITYMNLESNYKAAILTPPSGSEVLMEFIKKLLKNGDDEISDSLIETIIEPIQNESIQSLKCSNIPCHTIDILHQLSGSSNGISCLLGSRQKCRKFTAKLCSNHRSTNTSAAGMRKNRYMSISLERDFSAKSIRIPSSTNTNVSSPAKIIVHTTTILLSNQDMSNMDALLSLVEICSKLFRIHEGLSVLDAMNSHLISTVIDLYKQLSSKNDPSRYSSTYGHTLRTQDYDIQSHALYMSLVSFLTEVASTPCGVFALAQDGFVLQDLLTTLLQPSHVSWEDPHFRHIVSLITTVSQGISVLAEESHRILARPLCNLWSEYEDLMALITGSEQKQFEATQHFMNIICTFVLNLQGIASLLSDPESSSSEGTLVEADPGPTTLSELLTLESSVEPWHYISLLTLRALTTNMDVCLYLNNTIKFQLTSAAKKKRSTQPRGQTDFQRFLQDTKQGVHDANWLSHARRAYKASFNIDIKACVLIDLLEQAAKLSCNSESYLNSPMQIYESDVLFPEECLGIQVAIRYGLELHLLQENSQNEENLTQLIHLSHNLLRHKKCETFQGFDWFMATLFLLCGGNVERCHSCIKSISSLAVAPFLWPALATAKDQCTFSQHLVMFGHKLELLVKMELPLAFSALQLAGASWWLICRQWMAQCFWNILDWSQICHWLVVSVLNQPDFTLYFCVSLLRHIEPKILQAASEGKLWEQIMFAPMEGYHIGDQLTFMEKLSKRYRTSVLHHLLPSSNNTA
ncbi:protein broad-minded-like isoform X2 [Zootermopsis nevadensis]|uniref:protein broad-minded-like isoform X2 n=1 Tax=Zootermopsis nevadensis TaxID=136037 RepID=UPI000B8EA934|nr:protein broad-minded-like isoform X2 [Zootermopsis nevadensis]